MANHTLTNRFPESAAISVYDASAQLGTQAGPEGAVRATGTVSSGAVTFTGLTVGKQYAAFNDADSTKRVDFTVEAASTALASDANVAITGNWDFSGGDIDLPANSVDKADTTDDAVGTNELAVSIKTVTVLAGAATGTATVVASSIVLGCVPAGNQDQFIDNVAIASTTLTVTLAANATADNVFKVSVLEP